MLVKAYANYNCICHAATPSRSLLNRSDSSNIHRLSEATSGNILERRSERHATQESSCSAHAGLHYAVKEMWGALCFFGPHWRLVRAPLSTVSIALVVVSGCFLDISAGSATSCNRTIPQVSPPTNQRAAKNNGKRQKLVAALFIASTKTPASFESCGAYENGVQCRSSWMMIRDS